jgi:transposase
VRRVQKKLDGAVAEERAKPPELPVEVWATDEHRVGLKPILRGVWAPIGKRPIAVGHHRYEWLYVTGFVAPGTGEVVWYISTGIDKALFERMLATFAAETGAGKTRRIVLVLDNAGWHAPPDLVVPQGLRLVFLPPYSPELQPAERLWTLLDEPLVNRNFETLDDLDAILSERCRTLVGMPDVIRDHAHFHWWPVAPAGT